MLRSDRKTAAFVAVAAWFAIVVCSRAAVAQDDQGAAREIARHGAWTVLTTEVDGARTCFATAKPKSVTADAAGRGQPFVYISTWPTDGVKAEVSVTSGYVYRPGSSVTLTIGIDTFTLFTANDRAFVADPTRELKLIDAMKKGSMMLVEGISTAGKPTTDLFSLAGLTQTLAALKKACG